MKYKVTITSTDITGHEDEPQVFEDVLKEELLRYINKNLGKTILVEPMPEKQKITVWFYVVICGKSCWSVSKTHFNDIEGFRNIDIKQGHKVSEIKSMEVEI